MTRHFATHVVAPVLVVGLLFVILVGVPVLFSGTAPTVTPVSSAEATSTAPVAEANAAGTTPGTVAESTTGSTSGTATANVSGPRILEVLPELVKTDQTVTVTYTASGDVADVTMFAIGPDGEPVLEQSVPEGRDITHEYDRSRVQGLEGGPYDLVIEVEDTDGTIHTTTEEHAFTIGDLRDPDVASIGAVEYESTAGDFIEIDVALHDTDEAYLLLGGDRHGPADIFRAPLDVLHIDGTSSFLVNTRLLGTDRPSEEVFVPLSGDVTSYAHDLGRDSPPEGVFADLRFENENHERIAGSLSEFSEAAWIGNQIRPLQPGRYSMVLTHRDSIVLRSDGVPDPRFPVDRSNLVLTEPELGNVTTYLVPEGNANELRHEPDPDALRAIDGTELNAIKGMAIETDTITAGDRFLVEVEATGIWGSFVDALDDPTVVSDLHTELISAGDFAEFVNRPDGISFSITHDNPQVNVQTDEFDVLGADRSDVSVFTDPVIGTDVPGLERFYLLVDTRPPGAFPQPLEGGEDIHLEYAWQSDADERFTYTPIERGVMPEPYNTSSPNQFPYFPANATEENRSATISVQERLFEFDNTDPEGRPVVLAEPGQTISGTTTFPPGSDPVDIVIDKRHIPEAVEIEDVAIDGDGRFSITHDFSDVSPGDAVELELWAYEQKMAEREIAVFDSDADTTDFQIVDFHTQSVIAQDETMVDIAARVRNDGSLIGPATVELLVDGAVVEEQTVPVQVFDEETVRFEETAATLDSGTHALEVRTKDDSEQGLIVVDEALSLITVDSLTAEAPIEDGQAQPEITAIIENEGTIPGTDFVELHLYNESDVEPPRTFGMAVNETITLEATLPDSFPGEFGTELEAAEELVEVPEIDEVLGMQSLALMPGRNRTVVVDDHRLPDLDYGAYTVEVHTADDVETTELVIRDTDYFVNTFAVGSPLEVGDSLEATVNLTNRGNLAAERTVQLLVEGQVVDEQPIELAPGQSATLGFETDAIDRPAGRYNVSVATPDDELEETFLLEDPPDPAPDEDDPVEEPPADDEDPPEDEETVAMLGARGRLAAFVGTAIVAAIHVLGYWV